MNDLVLAGVLALLGGGGLAAVLVGKLVPQRTSREDRIGRSEDRVARLELRVGECETEAEKHRRVINAQTDYIFDLRAHIGDEKPPPPPDWPEGLKVR